MFLLTLPTAEEKKRISTSFLFRLILAILLFAFFMGARYDVGKDWLPMCRIYLDRLEELPNYYLEYHYAPFFYYLTTFLADNQLHYSIYFFMIALVQIAMLFYSLKNYPYVIGSVVLCFFLGCTWYGWANIARQSVAHVFVLAAICMLSEKKIFWCIFFMILAASSHKSALIMAPFLFLYNYRFKQVSITKQMLLACFTLIFSLFKIDIIVPALQLGSAIPFFSKYARMLAFDDMLLPATLGIGFYVSVFVNFLLIIHSEQLKNYYNSKFFNYLYMLFYIGILLEYLFIANALISRINVYFIGNRFIVLGFALYYFWKMYKNRQSLRCDNSRPTSWCISSSKAHLLLSLLLFCSFLTFLGVISKGDDIKVTYKFYWDIDNYELEEAKGEFGN